MDSASAPPLERGNNENASLEADDIDERMTEQALKDKTHRERKQRLGMLMKMNNVEKSTSNSNVESMMNAGINPYSE